MLQATLVTFATFLLEICSSSPVYNMQPAFITANIGTTGRNIRNLPCISRKTGQSGVCMFAIDCLKANGTHLGTCIDRFYFGSCCHIEPVHHDIIDNTIDSDILDVRVPPYRISSTIATTTTLATTVDSNATSDLFKFGDGTTTEKLSTTTLSLETSTEMSRTTSEQITSSTMLASLIPSLETTTIKPETTTSPKLQTFQSVDGTTLIETTTRSRPTTTTTSITTTQAQLVQSPTSQTTLRLTTTTTPKPTVTSIRTTTAETTERPTQRIPQTTAITTTFKPVTSKPTVRPNTTTAKPARTTTRKQVTSKPQQKPTKVTNKPVKVTSTRRPVQGTTTIRITKKPTKPTRKPTTTTVRPLTTTKRKATTRPTTRKPTTTRTTSTITTTTTPTTTTTAPKTTSSTTPPPTTITTVKSTTTSSPATTTVSNEIPIEKLNASSILETVNGNPATNEIEAVKPAVPSTTTRPSTKPSLVTWTVADERNTTSTPTTPVSTNTTTEEDWVPITTPDGWVLLPSVTSTTSSPATQATSPSTEKTTMSSPAPTTTTSTSTLALNASKPSITYIPIQTSTPLPSPILNTTEATTTTEAATSTSPTVLTTTSTPIPGNTTSVPESSTSNTTVSVEPEARPVNMSDFTDVCGRRMHPEARIVGGEKSSFGKWPWQISLRQWRTSTYLHKCGAALLNENWAITAAHCVDNVPPSDLLLRLGEHDLSTEGEPYLHEERRVQIVASHPQFDPRTFEYDLALLRFYEPVTFQPNILPVCVPQTDENFVGKTAYVTGWGRLYEDGPLPSVLQEVSVPVINNTVCESMYRSAGYIEHIPHIFICAGWRRGGFDSCEGDSGGPMVIQREDKRFLLAGVISWGIGCAEPNQPGVYTRISEFRDWINQILQF